MTMESDTYDTYLKKDLPDARNLCGEPEYSRRGLLDWDTWVLDPEGAVDGKVCTEAMALHGLKSWACWGHGSGDHFDAAATWPPTRAGPPTRRSRVFGLKTFSAQSTDRWVALKGVHGRCPGVETGLCLRGLRGRPGGSAARAPPTRHVYRVGNTNAALAMTEPRKQ